MRFPGLKLNEIGRNRGGELKFVALLCLATSLAVTTLLFTDVCLARRDTLSRFVPAQAAIYLHANRGLRATSWATGMLALPENVEADETARFALVNGDGSLSWGALFRWRAWQGPTPAERELLDRADATPIDERTFLVCDDRLAAAVLAAWGNDRALLNNRDAARALALARGLADLQVYADPEQLPREAGSAGLYLLRDQKAFALAAAAADGRVRLTILPADAMPKSPPWLGTKADPGVVTGPGPKLPPGSDLAVYGSGRAIDFHQLVFRGIDAIASASPLSDPAFARDSRSELDSMMSDFDAVAVYAAKDGSMKFYAACVGCGVDRVAGRIRDYANAAVPERRLVELPDQDTLTELVYSDQTVRWDDLGAGAVRSLMINDNKVGLYLAASGTDADQVILTNDAGLLATAAASGAPTNNESCALTGKQKAVIKPEIAEKMLGVLLGGRNLDLNPAKNVIIVQNDSGLLISCGYIGGNVDK